VESHLLTAGGVTYTYDGDGKRVKKSNGKLYWFGMGDDVLDETDLMGSTSNSAFNEYVFFSGKRIARRDSTNSVFYYFSDHLGTSQVIVQAGQATACYDADFYPFGGERTPVINSCPQHYKFTGKERDQETGLDDFGARMYGNALGRFLTPDFGGPLDSIPDAVPWADFETPQSLNLYGYARNNPTSFDDNDGHDCVVQTRTGDNTETFSSSSGNCDNVKVGDGQAKTFVDGKVTSIQEGADGHSIDIGFKANDGSGAVGVQNAATPYPDRRGLAYGTNQEGYRTLGIAGATMNDSRTYAIWFGASALAGAGGALAANTLFEGGLTTLGDLGVTPTAGEQAYAERLLAKAGKEGVQKAIRTLSKRLAEHEAKLRGGLKYPGTVEREVGNFIRTIKALTDVLK
jgi:RHS repeat-associated protein